VIASNNVDYATVEAALPTWMKSSVIASNNVSPQQVAAVH
jgi:hypothetical protein